MVSNDHIDSNHAKVGEDYNIHIDLVPRERRWDPATIRGFLELGGPIVSELSSGFRALIGELPPIVSYCG